MMKYGPTGQNRGQQTHSVKGKPGDISGFADHTDCYNYSILPFCSVKAATDDT